MTNPFELRFDAIKQAQGYLTDAYFANVEKARNIHQDNITAFKRAAAAMSFPTTEQIMDLAKTFNSFIDPKTK